MLRSHAARFRRALTVLLVAAVAVHAGGPQVPLDGVWFKFTAKASGYALDPDTSAMKKAHLGTKAFLHLSLASGADGATPGADYAWELWTRQDGNVWAMSDSGTHTFLGITSGDQLAVDLPLGFTLSDGRFLDGRGVFRFNIKLDKQGFLKKAKLGTLGGETVNGSTDGDNILVGKLTLKGHAIGPNKLPFDP